MTQVEAVMALLESEGFWCRRGIGRFEHLITVQCPDKAHILKAVRNSLFKPRFEIRSTKPGWWQLDFSTLHVWDRLQRDPRHEVVCFKGLFHWVAFIVNVYGVVWQGQGHTQADAQANAIDLWRSDNEPS